MSVLAVAPTSGSVGLYLIEAVASGIPVILPERGALGDLVAELDAGATYPVEDPEDDAQCLATCLREQAGSGC